MPKLRILVVDDDLAVLKSFSRQFGRDYDLVAEPSGPHALTRVSHEKFDVVIADYSMPGMTGVELLRTLAELHPEMGRLMMTAYADLPEVLECEATALAAAILPKPWEPGEVRVAIEKAHRLASMRSAVARMRMGVQGHG